jgi:hypothetical protein
MIVDMQIPGGFDAQIEPTVSGEQIEHVIQEPDAGQGLRMAGAVQVQFQMDLGLGRTAVDSRDSVHCTTP